MEHDRIDRVLIIDDDLATRQVLEKGLRRLGYAVEMASDGEEGLKLATAHPPDVLITDVQMPKMDGHTLLRRLKSQAIDSAVIMMSGHGAMEDVVDALRNGAVDYLKKPWTPGDLVAAVGRAAEIAETRRALRRDTLERGEPPLTDVPANVILLPRAQMPASRPTAVPRTAREGQDDSFAAILADLRSGKLTLPAVSVVLNNLRELITKPDATVDEVVAVIEQDQRLSAQVLRLANTVQHFGAARINDIQTAVRRVGFRQIENIAQTAFALDCYRETSPRFWPLQSKIWKYSLARAVSMRALAELAGPASGLDPALAYLAGLMSDVGASCLLWVVAERDKSGPEPRDAEALVDCASLIRAHHQEVGATLLASWHLDPLIAFIAGSHHADFAPTPPSTYWSLSVLASSLADELGGNEDVTRTHALSHSIIDNAARDVRIGHHALKSVHHRLVKEIEAMMETLC